MSQFFHIHPHNPQARLIRQAVELLQDGGLAVFPADATYVLGAQMDQKDAFERIRRLRRLGDNHYYTLLCRDFHDVGHYAQVDNAVFRAMKDRLPGPYTFLLPATKSVPRRLVHPKNKTIGIRIPNHPILQAILAVLGEPMMCSDLLMPGHEFALNDPEEMYDLLKGQVDMVLDGGFGELDGTFVLDCQDGLPDALALGEELSKSYL